MPKRSKEDTAITVKTILKAVEQQLIKVGYDNMSYSTLSKQTGISRTGISHHFPKKTDFIVALEERLYKRFIAYLVLNKTVTELNDSWEKALTKPQFVAILKVLFHSAVNDDNKHQVAKNVFEKLIKKRGRQLGDNASADLERLLGKSIVQISCR